MLLPCHLLLFFCAGTSPHPNAYQPSSGISASRNGSLVAVHSQPSDVPPTAANPPTAEPGNSGQCAAYLRDTSVQQVSTADLLDQYLAQHAGVQLGVEAPSLQRLSSTDDGGSSLSPGWNSPASQHIPTVQPVCSTHVGSNQLPPEQPVSVSADAAAASAEAAAAQKPPELGADQQGSTPSAMPTTLAGAWVPEAGLQIQHISLEFSQADMGSSGTESGTCSTQATMPATPQHAGAVVNTSNPWNNSSCMHEPAQTTGDPFTMAGRDSVANLPDLVGATRDSLAALDTILGCLDHLVQAVLLR
jgi:hypothetical protein